MTIYCLKDPRDESVFYIGRTSTRLASRLAQHIYKAQGPAASANRGVRRWINELRSLGLKPVIQALEETEDPGAEGRWHDLMLERKHPLLNYRSSLSRTTVSIATE